MKKVIKKSFERLQKIAAVALCVVLAGNNDSKPIIEIRISNGYWDYSSNGISKLSFFDETGKNPFDPENSALFGETVVIEDESKNISAVTIVKGKGITGFYDQKHNYQWISIK